MKLIFVTWWVMSGIWKWVCSSSIGRILKSAWYRVNMIKMDPYLQIDAGTMSPFEHWEVFVTDDWAETDLDVGNYERFIDENLTTESNLTSGKIYYSVISKERKWDYLGKTVQVIPHITNEIKERILKQAENYEITIIEVGWTVGDIESLPFVESIRQLKKDLGKENVCYVHLAPIVYACNEPKTKPIQHSVMKLREYWIQANILVCRTPTHLDSKIKEKLSLLCDIDIENIIEWLDVKTIYEVPIFFKNQNIYNNLTKILKLEDRKIDFKSWENFVDKIINPSWIVNIGIIGKYATFQDSYLSLTESIIHAWANNDVKVNINWIDAEELEWSNFEKILKEYHKNWKLDWVIIPWWFWVRWVQGKINTIKFVRENKIPFLGICLWLQTAVIEYARNVCKIEDADSAEFNENWANLVIDYIPEQRKITDKWGTMRLGAYSAMLSKDSLAYKLYWKEEILERHRHRYEVNPDYHEILKQKWLVLSWMSPNKRLVEFVEISNHPYFIATQAHPEFLSRPNNPHPLFDWLIKAVKQISNKNN